ncbi:MAG TPA: glycosyltransferase family 39 protein, partial [Syntrophorhabdaceae bacterium]|nr:glycosyltransferase family 39 protein [Syntrophorhabdaceae bacterium]
MQNKRKKKAFIYLVIIFLLSYFFFFFNLGSYSLKEPDEGRYAEIPREMVEQGDYLVPHFNYVRYFEKPPLLYWVVAASYKIAGVSESSFRFPNALAGLLCTLVLFWAGRRWFSAEVGLLSAIILMSSFGFFVMARIVTTDLLFATLLFATIVSFNEYFRGRKTVYLYLFYVFLALATLAKGPVAVLLVGLTILVYLNSLKELGILKRVLNVKGLLLYALVAMPWFLVMSMSEKGFFDFFFIDQHILRFVTNKHERSGPIYYFIPVIAAGMLPWSFFIPRAITTLWKSR